MSKLNIFSSRHFVNNVGKKAAWVESLYASGYKNVNLEEIKPLFDYLEFCLKQVCADN
jgi:magnesium chelatase subunit H